MRDVLALMAKEWKRSADPFAVTLRDALLNLTAAAFVAVFVPWLTGLGFLDALVIIPYAGLSIFFVAILTAVSFAGEPQRVEMRDLSAAGAGCGAIIAGKMAGVGIAGWSFGMSTLAAALAAGDVGNWHGMALLPKRWVRRTPA